MAQVPTMATVGVVGNVVITNRPIKPLQRIAEELLEKLGRPPTAKEVDDEAQTFLFNHTKEARIAAFKVEVVPSPTPFDEDVLKVSHNNGVDWQSIHLLPEERALVVARLTGK